MFRWSTQNPNGRLIGLVTLLFIGFGLGQGPVQAAEQPGIAAIQADCTAGWGEPTSDQGRYFPDLNAVYWSYRFDASAPNAQNTAFRISGQFAYARNMSFHFYPMLNNGAFSYLSDINITPNAGNVNPFLPGVNRHDSNRLYTIWLVPADSVRASQPNTLTFPAGSSLSKLMLRVYRADSGYNNGGVPLPTIEAFDDDTGQAVNCPLALRTIPSVPIDYSTWPADAPEVSFYHLGTDGFFPNDDNQYLVADLAPNKYAQILVLRFYAPSFLDTFQHPEAVFTGQEQVRFMSLCMSSQVSTKSSECIADDQFIRSGSGYYNVVVGPPSRTDIRDAAIARGYNYVGWYSLSPILFYRQMLPKADFAGSVARVPVYNYTQPEAGQRAENFIGIYAPVGKYCSITTFMGGSTCGMPAP